MASNLRRSQRVSQSNLRRSLQSLAASGNDEPKKDIVPVSTPPSHQSDLSLAGQQQTTDTRPYHLNQKKSLLKKLEDCLNENIKVIPKAGNNITIEFSAAAFEVAKTKISSLVQSAQFKRENECKPETSKDKQGAIVETRLKVYSKSKQKFRNNFGAHKYTINYYNTTSTMLVNGSRLDLFETHILQPLYDYIQENSIRIGEMNLQLGNALCTVLAPTSESDVTIGPKLSLVKNSKTNVNSNSRQTKSPKCKKQANLAIQSASQTPSQSPSREEDSTIYICPVCESQIENQASICCDTCDVWIHFSCANVDPDNTKELEDSEFICQICVDNALHIAKHKSPNMKTPLLAKENTYPLESHVQCEETLVKQPIQSLHVVEIHDVSTSDPITESSQTLETPTSHRNLTQSNHEINKTQSIIDTPGIPSPGTAPLVTSVVPNEQETESAQPVSKKQTSTK